MSENKQERTAENTLRAFFSEAVHRAERRIKKSATELSIMKLQRTPIDPADLPTHIADGFTPGKELNQEIALQSWLKQEIAVCKSGKVSKLEDYDMLTESLIDMNFATDQVDAAQQFGKLYQTYLEKRLVNQTELVELKGKRDAAQEAAESAMTPDQKIDQLTRQNEGLKTEIGFFENLFRKQKAYFKQNDKGGISG